MVASLSTAGKGFKAARPTAPDLTRREIVLALASVPEIPRRYAGKHGGVSIAARLAGLNLAGLDLSGLNLTFVDFTGSDLSGANLRGARLCGAWLSGAKLVGADLAGARLGGSIGDVDLEISTMIDAADFTDARLVGAHIDASGGADFTRADMTDAAVGGDVTECVFADADLTRCLFNGAALRREQLSAYQTTRASLVDVQWRRGPRPAPDRLADHV